MANNQLLKPVITEKTMLLAQTGRFTFHVPQSATKSSIKQAVESLFSVNVIDLNTSQLSGKTKRSGKTRHTITTTNRKKAVITLKPGQTIDYFQLPEDKKSKTKKSKLKTSPTAPAQSSSPSSAQEAPREKRGIFSRFSKDTRISGDRG